MAVTYHYVFDQGATVERVIRWLRDDVPVDLTGYSARMEIRSDYGGTLFTRLDTESNGGLTLGGTDGTITISIDSATTAAWEWRKGYYDLEVVDAAGDVHRLIQGRIDVSPEVTTDD